MAKLSFDLTVPDGMVGDIVTWFTNFHGYRVDIEDEENPGEMLPNPQTRGEYAREVLGGIIFDAIKRGKAQSDIQAAKEAAEEWVDENVIIS